ncbi:MAG: hypothetical protein GXO92_02980 [FCB group bacterium]|nr:hypothetical protein [FCB group bacterium]
MIVTGLFSTSLALGFTGNLSATPTKEPTTGRKFKLNDPLPDTLRQLLQTNPAILNNDSWKVGVCIFTRNNQFFSTRLEKEFSVLYQTILKDSIPVWEVISGASDRYQDSLSHPWPVIADPNFDLYQAFGIRVQPTIFIISRDWKIVDYLPGYSPALLYKLKASLGRYYPVQFPVKKVVTVRPEDKLQERKEGLARRLYRKRKFDMAEKQLAVLDSLSPTGHFLLGVIKIQQKDYPAAKIQFKTLLSDSNMKDYGHLGLGITAFYQDQPDSALYHLNLVRTIPEMYRVHYWRGRVLEQLGQKDDALDEYRKSFNQIFRKSGQIRIPE